MSLTLRIALGCTEAILDDDGGLKRFYQVADILSKDFHIDFRRKEDDFDSIDWDFNFHGNSLTLHYNIYTGVSLYPTHTKNARKNENKAVVELANVLEGKLINIDLKRTYCLRISSNQFEVITDLAPASKLFYRPTYSIVRKNIF